MNPKGLVYKKNKVANSEQVFLQQSQILAEQSQILVKHTLRQNFYWKIALFFILLIVGIASSVIYSMFKNTGKISNHFEYTMKGLIEQQQKVSWQQEEVSRLREKLTKDMDRKLAELQDQHEKIMRDVLAKKEASYQELLKSFQLLQKNFRVSEQEHQKSAMRAKKAKEALGKAKDELAKKLRKTELVLLDKNAMLKQKEETITQNNKKIVSLENKIEIYKATAMEKLPHKVILKLQERLRDDS